MKYRLVPSVLFCLACGLASCVQGNPDSVEITQMSFTGNAKNLVVVNQVKFLQGGVLNTKRDKCYNQLQSFAIDDWSLVGDTGELALQDLSIAPSKSDTWLFQAKGFNRFGTGTSNPYSGPVFCEFNPLSLRRKEIDLIRGGRDNLEYFPSAVALAGEKPLCAVHLFRRGKGLVPQSVFLFDAKAGKKTVELQDFPTEQRVDYFMKTVLAFTPDGNHVVSCHPCKLYQLQLHASDTGKLLQSMKLESPVSAMTFSPNGKMIGAVCWDGTLLVLEPDLSKQIFSKRVFAFNVHKYAGFPHAVAFVGDRHLAVLSSDTRIDLLDTKAWKSVRSFEEPKNRVNCLAGSPDGKLLAAGFGQTGLLPGFVRVWEVATGKLVKELK